jgi:hypothetical protein
MVQLVVLLTLDAQSEDLAEEEEHMAKAGEAEEVVVTLEVLHPKVLNMAEVEAVHITVVKIKHLQ